MKSLRGFNASVLLLGLALFVTNNCWAETLLKSFILAEKSTGEMRAAVDKTREKLSAAGFEIVGQYSPYADAMILIVSNDALKKDAAATPFGGFGAAQRVTLTKLGDTVQIAYTNPVYMANAYRMQSDLSEVREALKQALGDLGEYGPEKGLSSEDLRDYHYKWLMPYFYNRLNLASFKDYQTAIEKVEASLASENKGGAKKVFRIDIPGKQESLIGVSLAGPGNIDCSGDNYIMQRIDFKPTRSTGHLPYEVLVAEGKVYALPAEFRIAISFPDLSMVGSNSFASIMCAPTAISKALTLGVGGNPE